MMPGGIVEVGAGWRGRASAAWPSRTLAAALALASGGALAQPPNAVREIELRTEPRDAPMLPFESVTVRIFARGTAVNRPADRPDVRLEPGRVAFHLHDPGSGWLSKPFRYQGRDAPPLPGVGPPSFRSRLFALAERHSLYQDAVLFTASGARAEAVLSATLGGATGSIRIRVSAADGPAPSPERVTFGEQPRSPDPYRALAEHHAPFVAQETWFHPKSDYLGRFDADGDWRGDNNWANLPRASSQAYVYYAVIETETHWFLLYNFFHLRDYSDKCVSAACHENDNEGLILTVARDGSATGRAVAMETLAHNKVYSYRADPRVRGNFHNLDGEMEFYRGSHPLVFVHSGGHGVYGPGKHASYSFAADRFHGGTGVTYVYKGVAERPRHPSDREVGYDLLPIYDHWWLLAHGGGEGAAESFSDYFAYRPRGGRPRARHRELAGAFLGRRHGAGMAKPFWGWHDNATLKGGVLAKGQWALDPAYSASRNLTLPRPVSLRYTFNPYLLDPDAPPSGSESPRDREVALRPGP